MREEKLDKSAKSTILQKTTSKEDLLVVLKEVDLSKNKNPHGGRGGEFSVVTMNWSYGENITTLALLGPEKFEQV